MSKDIAQTVEPELASADAGPLRPTPSGTFYIPLDLLTTPATGECIVGSWWSVHPTHGVAFYAQLTGYGRSEAPSPQCNQSEGTSRALTARLYPDHEVRQIPVAYTAHAAREFGRLKAAAQLRGSRS